MRATWYVLEDGSVVDPAEVSHGDDGRLVHTSGVLVAMKGNVPHSRGVDLDDLPKSEAQRGRRRDMQAESARPYKTRVPASSSE